MFIYEVLIAKCEYTDQYEANFNVCTRQVQRFSCLYTLDGPR